MARKSCEKDKQPVFAERPYAKFGYVVVLQDSKGNLIISHDSLELGFRSNDKIVGWAPVYDADFSKGLLLELSENHSAELLADLVAGIYIRAGDIGSGVAETVRRGLPAELRNTLDQFLDAVAYTENGWKFRGAMEM